MAHPTARDVLAHLWKAASLPPAVLGKMSFTGPTHCVASSFRIGVAAQASIAATALAAALLRELRTEVAAVKAASDGSEQQLLEEVYERVPVVSIDSRDATLEFASEKHVRILPLSLPPRTTEAQQLEAATQAYPIAKPEARRALGIAEDAQGEWDVLAGVYPTKDGWVRLHTNFEHHKAGLLQILHLLDPTLDPRQLTPEQSTLVASITREQVRKALTSWRAEDFETAARARGMCATKMRSEAEWDASSMGIDVREWVEENGAVPFRIGRIEGGTAAVQSNGIKSRGSSEPSNKLLNAGFGNINRPLRVLDLSRVLAGPIAARTLTGYGAQTLLLSSPSLPNLPLVELDTARGKRTAWVDLDDVDGVGKETLRGLIGEADVLLQAYRPKGIESRGFSPQDVQCIKPGIVYASLSAYGPVGPWADGRGFDSLTQTATGMNHSEALSYLAYKGEQVTNGEAVEPKAMPCQALDHAAAYMLAFGILASQVRSTLEELTTLSQPTSTAPQGWHVEVSLAAVSLWLKSLGRLEGVEAWEPLEVSEGHRMRQLRPLSIKGKEVTLFAVAHAAKIEGFEMDADASPGKLGAFEAQWW